MTVIQRPIEGEGVGVITPHLDSGSGAGMTEKLRGGHEAWIGWGAAAFWKWGMTLSAKSSMLRITLEWGM